MLKNYIILTFEPIDIIDRFGTFLFKMTYDEFINSKYRLLDYDVYILSDRMYIKITEPIIE